MPCEACYVNTTMTRDVQARIRKRIRDRLDDLDTWMTQLDELEESMAPAPQQTAPPTEMVPMGEGLAPPMVPQAAPPVFNAA